MGHDAGRLSLRRLPGWMLRDQRSVVLFLTLLVTVDLAFVIVHCWSIAADSPNLLLRVDMDRSYPEVYQAIKYVFLSVLIVACAMHYRSWRIGLWLVVTGYFFLDDIMMLREKPAIELMDRWDLPLLPGLRALDTAELILIAAAAGLIVIPLLLGYLTGGCSSRRFYRVLGLFTLLLVVFGVGVDMLHVLVMHGGLDLVSLLEDGGEMIVVSLMTAAAFRLGLGEQGEAA